MESGVVALAMVDYWVSFAVSGTPNDGNGLPSTTHSIQPSYALLTEPCIARNYLASIYVRQPGTFRSA